jgi:hypothetical protein
MNSRDLSLLHVIEDLYKSGPSNKTVVMYRKHCYLIEKINLVDSGKVVLYRVTRCMNQCQICRFVDTYERYNETVPKMLFNAIRFDKESEDV